MSPAASATFLPMEEAQDTAEAESRIKFRSFCDFSHFRRLRPGFLRFSRNHFDFYRARARRGAARAREFLPCPGPYAIGPWVAFFVFSDRGYLVSPIAPGSRNRAS